MKEIYRAHDVTKVCYYRDILEAAGIPTMIRNEHLVHGVVEVPIPEFFPNVCVLNDEDYPQAWELLNTHIEANKAALGPDVSCPSCGEINPGNFAECFSCQTPLPEYESC